MLLSLILRLSSEGLQGHALYKPTMIGKRPEGHDPITWQMYD